MPNAHFTPTPGGPTYRIIKNADIDLYGCTREGRVGISRPLKRSPPRARESSRFGGKDRWAVKLSIGTGETETFLDVSKLIATLPSLDVMSRLKIPLGPTSGRVSQEQRNIRVTGFLYAATREPDNDFYLVVGRAPNAREEMYMLMDVSGLPPQSSPAFAPLDAVRKTYERFFRGKNLPSPSPDYDYYEPAIPVKIEGSLFFHATHSLSRPPAPSSLMSRMQTEWRVHPITSIQFGP